MIAVIRKCLLGFVFLSLSVFLFTGPVFAEQVILSWFANTEPDLAGYVLYYKDDSNSFPLTKTQFTQKIEIPANQTSYTKIGLGDGTHRFALTAFDVASNESNLSAVVQKTISASAPVSSDAVPPEISSILVEQKSARSATITWNTDEFSTSQIAYRRASDPASETRTTRLNMTLERQHVVTLTGLDPATTYEYQVFSQDNASNAANSEIASFRTKDQTGAMPDTTPPGDLRFFTASSGDQNIILAWENPDDSDFAGIKIRFRVDRFPEDINDGELLADLVGIPNESMDLTHSGLENGLTYYYLAATYDQAGNFQTTVFAEATPIPREEGAEGGGGGCGMVFPVSGGNPPGPGDAAEMLLLFSAIFILFVKKHSSRRIFIHRVGD